MRLVADSSSIISLYVGGVLDKLFLLAEVYTTDLIADELTEPSTEDLRQMGLKICSLSKAELNRTEQIVLQKPDLSLQDGSVIILAQSLVATVLADDKPLREFAQTQGLAVHGSLWVIEQLASQGQIDHSQVCTAIENMLNGGRRLPRREVQRIQKQYGC